VQARIRARAAPIQARFVIRITLWRSSGNEAIRMPMGLERGDPITVYGTTWCKDCHLAKAVLRLNGVDYTWVDIDREPAAVDVVLRLNHGQKTVPTIVFPDGRVLIEPSRRELEAALVPPPESHPAA